MLYFQHKAQEKVLLSLELLLLESQKLKWLQDGYILESQFGYCHCPRAARESNAHVAPWGHCPLIQERASVYTDVLSRRTTHDGKQAQTINSLVRASTISQQAPRSESSLGTIWFNLVIYQ